MVMTRFNSLWAATMIGIGVPQSPAGNTQALPLKADAGR
jgi:hypothetical protein